MNLIIVSCFFSIWVLIVAAYAFLNLNKAKNPVRFFINYGWVAKWNMFVPDYNKYINQYHGYAILYRDIQISGSNSKIGQWEKITSWNWKPNMFIINTRGRLIGFNTFISRKLIALNILGKKDLSHADSFKFLCRVVCDIPPSTSANFRQVKFEHIQNKKAEILAQSEFIPLK